MDPTIDTEARQLWQAWQTEMAQDRAGVEGDFPFTDQVEQLLGAQRLEVVVDHLFGIVPPLGTEDDLEELATQSRGQAWATPVSDDTTTVLVAVPVMGNVAKLALDDAFWQRAHQLLQTEARRFLNNPEAQLQLVPFNSEVHNEAASCLTMDDGRNVLLELAHERPGAATQRLLDCEAVMRREELKIKSPGYVVHGQRVGLAALVLDDATWGDMDTFTTFMAGLDELGSWRDQFVTDDRLVMPPMTLVQALTENLAAHMVRVVMDGFIDRDMTLPEDTFELTLRTLDQGEESHVVEIGVYLDDIMLDPILIPAGWVATIGVEGFQKATQILQETIGHHAQMLADQAAPEADEDEETFVPPPTARRRRLH